MKTFNKFINENEQDNSSVGKKCKFGTKMDPSMKIYSGTIEEDFKDGTVTIVPDKGNGKTIFDKSGNPITLVLRRKIDVEILK